ncbi:acyl carrier protein [Bacteroides fragilis]|nr:acyl carrier protein [Bacteroides fragilis]WMI94666.1 acyl carrier protein [Bacteroides fragilis]
MEMDMFLNHFADLFDETDTSIITENTNFKDLEEWSSMIIMGIIAMADEEYAVRLKGDDIRKVSTVKDLYNLIQSRRG